MTRYFMSYATANEGDYFADFLNFKRLSQYDPGVPLVELFLVVSEVYPSTDDDLVIAEKLMKLAGRNPNIRCRSVRFKSNVGRDFSSAALGLSQMSDEGSDADFTLFVNRSGFGPYCDGWYSKYADHLRVTGSALVGSTINFLGYREQREISTHVQTYAYLSRLGTLRPLIGRFPAETEVDRTALIDTGEIGLSASIMEAGGSLSCLAWPEYVFDLRRPTSTHLPHRDIKGEVSGFPFIYKRSLRREVLGRLHFEYWRRMG